MWFTRQLRARVRLVATLFFMWYCASCRFAIVPRGCRFDCGCGAIFASWSFSPFCPCFFNLVSAFLLCPLPPFLGPVYLVLVPQHKEEEQGTSRNRPRYHLPACMPTVRKNNRQKTTVIRCGSLACIHVRCGSSNSSSVQPLLTRSFSAPSAPLDHSQSHLCIH